MSVHKLFCENENGNITDSELIADEGGWESHYYGLYHNIITKDYEKMLKYYHISISKNNRYSMRRVGYYYRDAGCTNEGEKFFLMAAEFGDINAMYSLGLLYDNTKRIEEAKKYYLMAIEHGDVDAMNNVANLYSDEGLIDIAIKYHLMAIEHGDVDSMFNIGKNQ